MEQDQPIILNNFVHRFERGFQVVFQNIPSKLTRGEAEKLMRIIMAYVEPDASE